MGDLVLTNEEMVAGPSEEVFELLARPSGGGWLFSAECDRLCLGAPVRLRFPTALAPGEDGLAGTGRIVALDRPHSIRIEQHAPWPAQLTCTVADVASARDGPRSQVRLVAEVPERALDWLLRRRGVALPREASTEEEPIGLLTSQSGPASMVAGACENVARMAIDEINADGPPLGRPLRLVLGDEGSSAALTALEARRLVDAEGCSVVIGATTCPGFCTVSETLRDRAALLIHPLANEGGPTGDRLLRLGERPRAQLEAGVPHVMSAADGTRWFLAGTDISWPRATHACARQVIDRAGGMVVGERLLPFGSREVAALVDQIERSGADCVLSTFLGADAVAFEREVHRSGLRRRVQTLAPALDEATLEHIGTEASAGIWGVFGYFEGLPTAENHAFVRRYRQRFGAFSPPLSSHSESIYETVHLVAAAARRARSWHPTEVGRAMDGGRFHGPRGPVEIGGRDGLQQDLFLAEATGGTYAVRQALGPAASDEPL